MRKKTKLALLAITLFVVALCSFSCAVPIPLMIPIVDTEIEHPPKSGVLI